MSLVWRLSSLSYFLFVCTSRSIATSTDFCMRLDMTCSGEVEEIECQQNEVRPSIASSLLQALPLPSASHLADKLLALA